MKILVCVKQVPDMESSFRVNSDETWLDERDLTFRMNEYDEFSLEQAVQVKEQEGGSPDITVLSIGPARVVEVIKKGLAMGADRGVHIQDNLSHQKDPWQIASVIAGFAREKHFDLIFFGLQSQDMGSAQVGPFVAELLSSACVTGVVGFALHGNQVTVQRELEGGLRAEVKFKLPGVVTCQLGLNTPRYPTLPNIMRAKQKELLSLPIEDFLKQENLVSVQRMYRPQKKSAGIVLEGDLADLADRLVTLLKEKTNVVR